MSNDGKKVKSLSDLSGVGQNILNKLVEAGYSSLEAVAVATPQDLSVAAGIPQTTAQRIIKEAREALDIRFKTALEVKKERMNTKKITTGSQALDGLLGGGIETRTMTEFFGEFGSGKTQLCHQISISVQLPQEKGGLNGKAVYIDTEGTFRWERIEAMAKGAGLESDIAMNNIYYMRAINSDHQMAIVDDLQELITKDPAIKLIIVDSITSHFRAEYPGRENLAVRQQKLNKHLHQLVRLAEMYDIAVIITNQVMARPDMFYGDPTTAVGGHTLYHVPGIRVQLKKSRGNKRIARIVDAPHLPEGEVVFAITEEGVRDAEE
ncbi:DNA repair and recombination protein RadA [Sulfolobus acidocaldarius]|uniref:DNA repair and recombination protein RadA n=5 Tax=Sulfolobus acidocaldarius TaxID=2285 RepID=RADA_SULAC|nr:DNA repair and recombination protein RadA [Sulfolobus acidocaldarius]Q4JAT5.1 RecName: Full=DNA repair and recombination protein RadA [Sulfolobus acidocaldarius DSM 639]AAY80094.1 DNA recombination protein RadA [Sulfolobus acidocaldarius DSM 639]AGE70663.1 DNA repair and recombination protein RadA [Sulfolobus acidocaldarius N8]AGE72936.1 DNA repair and recombination protein RadA [Sulfolobus acidocaldarius Ron12/I]ALU28991.1 DNA repair and recombination protein RadA [Sulfolobus acidocaldariu